MAKRKRQEQTAAVEGPRDMETKKIKVQDETASAKDLKPKKKVAVVPEVSAPAKPKVIRIIVGSYEKVLCGINAKFDSESTSKVLSSVDVPDYQNKLALSPVYMFSAHTGSIKCLAVNDRYLVSGGSDEVIKIYDLKKRKDLGSLVQHSGAITALQFYSRTHLLSASEDGTICIWRTRDWECMATMKGHKGRVNGLSVHPSGKIAISVGKDKALRLWNLMTGRKASANKLGEEAFDVKWNATGDQYAILFDRRVVIYNMNAEPCTTIEHHVRIHCIQYFNHPVHGETLVTGTDDKLIRIHSVLDGKVLQDIKGHRARIKAFDTTIMSHGVDFRIFASASSDGEVKTWVMSEDGSVAESGSYDTGNRILCLALHDASIEQLDFFAKLSKEDQDSDASSSSDDGEGDEEWNGIEDA